MLLRNAVACNCNAPAGQHCEAARLRGARLRQRGWGGHLQSAYSERRARLEHVRCTGGGTQCSRESRALSQRGWGGRRQSADGTRRRQRSRLARLQRVCGPGRRAVLPCSAALSQRGWGRSAEVTWRGRLARLRCASSGTKSGLSARPSPCVACAASRLLCARGGIECSRSARPSTSAAGEGDGWAQMSRGVLGSRDRFVPATAWISPPS